VEAAIDPTGELAEMRRTILGTPAGFARAVLGVPLYDWQADFLNTTLEKPGASSMRAPNEAGKTRNVIAPMVLFVLAAWPGAQVVITSGSFRQVQFQLFPAMRAHSGRFPGWKFHEFTIQGPGGSQAVGFSTDDPNRFEGFHVGPGGHRETPLLLIYDEAKSIDESIFMAGDRCRPTWEVMLSSTGLCTGRFYRSHTSQRSLYRTFKITMRDCPHIAPETYARDVQKYGENHWFIRSAYWGEFSEDGAGNMVMTLRMVEECLAQPVAPLHGSTHGFCDFAAGRAENVFYLRRGNVAKQVQAWTDRNTMSATGEFISLFRKEGFTPETAWQLTGDADGLGGPMLDRMAELGWRLNRYHGNAKASDPRVYYNRSAETWAGGRQKIERRWPHLPKDDQQLIEQLTGRQWKRFSDGTLQLESKEEMAARGLASPDRADALLGCLEEPPIPAHIITGAKQDPLETMRSLEEQLAGADGSGLRGWNAGG